MNGNLKMKMPKIRVGNVVTNVAVTVNLVDPIESNAPDSQPNYKHEIKLKNHLKNSDERQSAHKSL